MKKSKGFTLIELIVVIVIIGILAAIAIPRFMGAQDRARIGAAEAEVTKMREALGLYEIDWSTYATSAGASCTDYDTWKASVVDKNGNAYMSLPDTLNFDPATFAVAATETTFTLQVDARDANTTTVYGNPEKTWH